MPRLSRFQRLLRELIPPVAALMLMFTCMAGGTVCQAATVARKVFVTFDGTVLGGNAYTLGPGEIDVTGTFRKNGAATVAGGIADIPGNLDPTNSGPGAGLGSGFYFNATFGGVGNLKTQNWVCEAIVSLDVPVANQPATFNHILDVQGDTFFRLDGNGHNPKITDFGYWDGVGESFIPAANMPVTAYNHVALVWTAASNGLQAYINGVSQGTVSTGAPFDNSSSPYVGYGFFARFLNRAIDGKLDAAAFSTYTGAFNPGFGSGFDFQLDPNNTSPVALKLAVNAVSGHVSIVNNTSSAIVLQGYEVNSPAGSLEISPAGWHSLADQNLDPVLGGDGPGETWQEGANPSSQAILEGFLLGSTSIAPGSSLSLGRAYDESLDARDLQFKYRLAGQSGIVSGTIGYDLVPPQLSGDYDNDYDVDGSDFLAWQRALGGTLPLPNDPTPASVDASDLSAWRTQFGAVASSVTVQYATLPVPEPAGGTLPWLAIAAAASAASPRSARRGASQARQLAEGAFHAA